MKTSILAATLGSFFLCASVHAEITVATLHPALTDIVQQVGGDKLKVVPMLKPGSDPHDFSPKPEDIKQLASVRLIFASGKGLETYLGKLQDNLGQGQQIVEVGKTIPDITEKEEKAIILETDNHDHEAGGNEDHDHEDGHHHDGKDPHWWNSVDSVKRATGVVAESLTKVDPANGKTYEANATAYTERLDELKRWAKKELSKVPQANRKIATAHLSMTYFAREFGFKLIAVQGLSPTAKVTSRDLAEAVAKIRKHQLKAVFPEQGVNAKQLKEIVSEAGVKQGGELVADGNGAGDLASFEKALRHNVETIVAALQ